ncbi:hypothetical protein QWZ13_07540 [Reinekea marina]|uniref:ABC transmembrane type-1 domain-containing protein n=1 Tax=Reinekea marina TaxID=1310421 RepID=A0ABV7WVH9_9GAMM|nr:hypothetical protein [Reinekea marina]MDN3648762.1 hypothetical protein [Reinekea marina]
MPRVSNRFLLNANRVAMWLMLATLVFACIGLFLHPGQGYPLASYFDAWMLRIIQFSLVQAFLSAFISVLFAIPFALILSSKTFRFNWIIKALLNLFFIMPVLTIVLSVISFYGNWVPIFSIVGIVLAHVMLNLPYALRIFWQRLDRISLEHKLLAQSIGMSPFQQFKVLQWPVILSALKPVFVIVFLFCFSSFTIVLTLGGGPANTNLEVAIYQALKFDFDPKGAAIYALVHGVFAVIMMLTLGRRKEFSFEFSRSEPSAADWPNMVQCIALGFLAIVLGAPLVSLALHSVSQPFEWPNQLLAAISNSLVIAFLSAVAAVVLALARCESQDTKVNRVLDFGVLLIPTMVILTGLFLLAMKFGVAYDITWPLIIWMNALMALPFISNPIHSRFRIAKERYQPLVRTLSLSEVTVVKYIYWPILKSSLPWAFALSMVLSVGDLGVAALVGSAQFITLPILIYQAMGSYQMVFASQLSALLLFISLAILMFGEWFSEEKHARR